MLGRTRMKFHVLFVSRLLHWHSSPEDGGRYDMEQACPICGTGAVRIDPLFVSPSACKEGIAATLKQQVLVSKDVFGRLSQAGVKGLRQAVSKKTREPVDFWSLEPEAVLPPWASESRGFEFSQITPPCPACHRDGHFDSVKVSLRLVYDTLPSADILATWEHFGVSRMRTPFEKSLFAVPRLLVSDRVRNLIHGSKGVGFAEVETKMPNKS